MSILLRLISSTLAALILGTLIAPFLIKKLRILKFGQQIITEYGPTWHKNKQGVPTMGGILFIIATVVSYLIFGFSFYIKGESFGGGALPSAALTSLFTAVLLGAMGFADDFTKIRKKHNEGLTERQKIVFQTLIGIAFLVYIGIYRHGNTTLRVPFIEKGIDLGIFFYLFAFIAFIGFVNGCNLTDGIDGLAASVTLPVMLLYTAYSYYVGAFDLSVLSASFFGGLIAYLFFNWHPARVFMGDTGSMFLGGMVVTVAFSLDIPFVLFLAGFIYLVEAFSVLIQRVYFKATHGKRLFKMTPIHHSFELSGWSEVKIVLVFTAVSALMCGIAAFWLF